MDTSPPDYEKLFPCDAESHELRRLYRYHRNAGDYGYYKTDTHWSQEKLPETAAVLAEGMGTSISGAYTEYALDVPFYGVYYGQSALPLPPETLYYLSNDVLDGCIVTNHEDQTMGSIYNMEKKSGKRSL